MDKLPPLSEVVRIFDIAPKKTLGQNFLFDMNLTNKITKSVSDITNSTILEIGPGPGGLTRSLLNNGAKKVIVIEKDKRCIEALEQIKIIYPDRLEIIEADALEINEEELFQTDTKPKIVANLPYNISTTLLFKWLDRLELFSGMILMFQKEVADRITASPRSKAYGRLSVMSQFSCLVRREFDIHPSAFVPAPKVFSSVVSFIPKTVIADVNKDILSLICKTTFNQRRKFLSSSLKPICDEPTKLLASVNIKPSARPEELSLDDFCKLAKAYREIL
jgi:16S rRNA (adenine1518-N6/adenine1519-N6)-dimethyltransferase